MEDYVIPPERGLDAAPDTDEGEILDVELDRVDNGRHNTTKKACQKCKEPVELTEPHVFARGWQQASTGRVYFRAVFCDRKCWAGWASSGT